MRLLSRGRAGPVHRDTRRAFPPPPHLVPPSPDPRYGLGKAGSPPGWADTRWSALVLRTRLLPLRRPQCSGHALVSLSDSPDLIMEIFEAPVSREASEGQWAFSSAAARPPPLPRVRPDA
ncbi:hypothetical protein NDU88_003577 [Pleurodeles waltl]|uniref:Uncharacterized protein n=1 Tax=Pleurodeles waltl TaxID=8319 RepID=A0AAV7NLU9_PLEWA|nr:hypothetical protein NDU88_003577 [Pleurodeles waltl]